MHTLPFCHVARVILRTAVHNLGEDKPSPRLYCQAVSREYLSEQTARAEAHPDLPRPCAAIISSAGAPFDAKN
jgi:hypothetical protein